ncbi:DUF803 domain-containing protein, partial [Toxoplasma gondii TgCatPRC2]
MNPPRLPPAGRAAVMPRRFSQEPPTDAASAPTVCASKLRLSPPGKSASSASDPTTKMQVRQSSSRLLQLVTAEPPVARTLITSRLCSRVYVHLGLSTLLSGAAACVLLGSPELTSALAPAGLADASQVRRLSSQLPHAIEEFLNVSGGMSLFIGILLTLVGSVLMAGGSTMMKVGIHLESERAKNTSILMCEPMWLGGFGAYTLGALMHVVALAFAPASVLAPMNSIGLIANAITAATVLKEPFGFQEFLFTGGTALGVTLCACATLLPHDEFVNMGSDAAMFSEKDVGLYSWRDPWYLAYLACCVVPGFGTLIYVNSEESAQLEEQERYMMASPRTNLKRIELARLSASQASSGAGGVEGNVGSLGVNNSEYSAQTAQKSKIFRNIQGGNDDSRCALLDDEDSTQQQALGRKTVVYSRCIGLCYGFLAGLTGAQCVLELKELAACFHAGMDDPTIWHHPQPYLVVVFLVASVWTQIHFLNLGLARGEATLVVPTYYVSWTFFGTLGGFAKFHEIQGFSVGAIILFALGFGLTILCIAILAVQEMTVLRRYVDERVPDLPEAELDLPTQELQEQQLAKQVTLAMGLFPFSMLGRTVGRKRFRPLYQRFRRTRSTASDTALNDSYGELTLSSAGVVAAYTLPHNLHFNRGGSESLAGESRGSRREVPEVARAESLGSSPFSRHLSAAGRQTETHSSKFSSSALGESSDKTESDDRRVQRVGHSDSQGQWPGASRPPFPGSGAGSSTRAP